MSDSIDIDIPSSWKTFLNKHSDESKFLGSYLSGAFITFLSTPCTAPFIGTAMSLALSMSSMEVILVFAMIGLGMSTPYIMFMVAPKTLNVLHFSRKITKYLSQAISIFIYLTITWLLWILSSQLNLLPVIVLFLICILLKFILEVRIVRKFAKTKYISIALLIFTAFYIPLYVNKVETKIEKVISGEWHAFSNKKLGQYIKSGGVVLVDVTADWCITCKYNKAITLNSVSLINFAREKNLILLRADYTTRDDEITEFLATHKRYGIPFNIMFSPKYPKGIILPVVLKYSDIVNAYNKSK